MITNRWQTAREQLQQRWGRYQKYAPAAFFVFGFLFDVITMDRIDSWMTIVQQAVYLFLITLLLSFMVFDEQKPVVMPPWLQKLWNFRTEALHFLFGSLLSAYTLFYFKSSSIFTSFLFMGFLIALLIINELPQFQKLGLSIKYALLSLCLISYLAYVIPIWTGRIGLGPFMLEVGLTAFLMALMAWFYKRKGLEEARLSRQVLRPSFLVLVAFLALYWFRLIPPVPLSIQFAGIYHDIKKSGDGKYQLYHERPWWRFWHHGDQDFVAEPGDRIHCFVSVFSPTNFKDRIHLHWLFKDPRAGWQTMDKIPFVITGGRDEGFRGFAYKSNYQPGQWRIQIETLQGHEIGRIYFEVTTTATPTDRQFQITEL